MVETITHSAQAKQFKRNRPKIQIIIYLFFFFFFVLDDFSMLCVCVFIALRNRCL